MINTNWKNYAELAKTDKTDNHGYKDDFLNHCLPLFASIPLKRNADNLISAADSLLPYWKDDTLTIKTPNGKMNGRNLINLMSFVYRVNRSKFLTQAMTKAPRFGTFTPLPMYAHKLYNDVSYGEYARVDDIWTRLMLGNTFLAEIVTVESNPKILPSKLRELRKAALTYSSGVNKGKEAKITLNKMRVKSINGTPYPVAAMYMYFQVWLANGQLRDKEAMILDPVNWGNVPDAWDAEIAAPVNRVKTLMEDSPI